MTTPEQQAREMLGRMKVEHADYYSAGDLIELANLIAKCDALKAELAAIKGAGEPVAWVNSSALESAKLGRERYGNQGATELHTWSEGGPSDYHDTPLYTRPCVPLMDEKVKELICEHFVTGENLFNEVHQDYRFRSLGTATNVWGADLLKFARAIEAHIKGAKG